MSIDATIRELIAQTRPSPLPAAFDRIVENQPELAPPTRARCGTARITANDGGGAYTITETARVAGALAKLTAPDGFVDRVAYAIDDSDSWEVDDDVFYMQVPTDAAAGTFATYIERGSAKEETAGYVLDTTTYAGACGVVNLRIQDGKVVAFSALIGGLRWYDAETGEVIP